MKKRRNYMEKIMITPRRSVQAFALAAVLIFLLGACATAPDAAGETVSDEGVPSESQAAETEVLTPPQPWQLPYPALFWQDPVPGQTFYSETDGLITAVETEPDGRFRVVVASELSYFSSDGVRNEGYELVMGGLGSVNAEPGPVKRGDAIGTFSDRVYISARTASLNDYLLRMSGSHAFHDGHWYALPNWFIPSYTQWLSFRPVDDFQSAAADFLSRWRREDDISDSGFTIHYFPEYDRIRVPFVLEEYPQLIAPRESITVTEQQLLGHSGLIASAVPVALEDEEYDALLLWQGGFIEYLRDEYTLGETTWLYLSLYTIDHDRKQVLAFVRDFAPYPDEEIIEERRADLLGGN
jgi:hypothetical protein